MAPPPPAATSLSIMAPPKGLAPIEVTKDGKDILSLLRIGSKSKGGHLSLPTPKGSSPSPSSRTWSTDSWATTPRFPTVVPEDEEMLDMETGQPAVFSGTLMSAPYMETSDDVMAFYRANKTEGLTSEEVERRRAICGKNALKGRRSLHPVIGLDGVGRK